MTVKVISNSVENPKRFSFSELITIPDTMFVDVNNNGNFIFVNHCCEPFVIRYGQIFSVANNTSWHFGKYEKCNWKVTVEIENQE